MRLAGAATLLLGLSSASAAAGPAPAPAPPHKPGWEPQHRHDGGGFPYTPPSYPDSCLGEYSFCNTTGACVLDSEK